MKTLFVSVMLLKASLYKNKKEYFTYFGGRQGQTSTQSGSINGNIPLPRGGAVPYRRPRPSHRLLFITLGISTISRRAKGRRPDDHFKKSVNDKSNTSLSVNIKKLNNWKTSKTLFKKLNKGNDSTITITCSFEINSFCTLLTLLLG